MSVASSQDQQSYSSTRLPFQFGQFTNYEAWHNGFIKDRLYLLYLLAVFGNLPWLLIDYLQGEYWLTLMALRMMMEVCWIFGFLFIRYPRNWLPPGVLLVFGIVGPNICISEMTVVLGGFSSLYYFGIVLLFLCATVVMPVSWKTHAIAQGASVLYYVSANILRSQEAINWADVATNLMIIAWTCIVLTISVILYERLFRAEFDARSKLLELDRLKSEFFANVSHEIRTPLTLAVGSFKSLKNLSLRPEANELVDLGLRNSSRLLLLISELLDLSKLDSRRMKLKKRSFDLSDLIRSVGANFQSSKGRQIHYRGLTNPAPIEGDPHQLKKVIYNLLSNAFKFSDSEEGQVWIKLNEQPETVQLEFEDNGIGIPHEQLDKIFDRFSQVEGTATRRFEGTGIGLALVKEIIQLHGGSIAVESKLGEGSVFTITLPRGLATLGNLTTLDQEEFLERSIAKDGSHEDSIVGPKSTEVMNENLPTVLVVDDNSDMRAYLQRILVKHFRLHVAKDGQEAFDIARAVSPDLILTDMMMPHMSGDELLKRIRNDPTLALVPIIFLTARASSDTKVESLQEGADDYIQKPFEEKEVLARIQNLIRSRQTEKKLAELQKEKLSRFLPMHVTDLILSDNAKDFLKGHRTEITVLFIDLRGFTAFAESAEPEDLMKVLSEYQDEMGKIITEYQGTLERFSGDGMMVFFNDPLPITNHQIEAARCALAMLDRITELQKTWKEYGFDLGAGIGMASGFATIGVIGFKERQDYTAIGSVTNLAARLCTEAGHGQILIPERFKNKVSSHCICEPVGEVALKGFQKTLPVFTLCRLNS